MYKIQRPVAKWVAGLLVGSFSLLSVSESLAQVKVGSNPTVLDANASLEVEASTIDRTVKVDKTTGQVTIKDGTQGEGRLLTSDAEGNASWAAQVSASDVNFFASFTGSQAASDVLTSKIDFTTASPNVGNGYNVSTDRFVAPVAGTYYFIGTAYVHPATAPTVPTTYRDVLSIKVNGVARITQENFQYQLNAGNAFNISLLTRLAAGDYVELFGNTQKPDAVFAGYASSINAPQTTFQGFLIGK